MREHWRAVKQMSRPQEFNGVSRHAKGPPARRSPGERRRALGLVRAIAKRGGGTVSVARVGEPKTCQRSLVEGKSSNWLGFRDEQMRG